MAHRNKVRFGSKYHFHNALRKNGFNVFEWEILVDGIKNKIELDKIEIEYIKKFDSIKNGYNMSTGGGGGDTLTSHPNREEICKKMSDKQKGRKMRKDVKENWYKKMYVDNPDRFKGRNNPMYGKRLSEERKKQISEQHKGNTYMKGRKLSDETKKKISDHQKGKPKSVEFKKMMSKVHKGKVLSKETKLKISISQKIRIKNKNL